jgi:hypothetical protein
MREKVAVTRHALQEAPQNDGGGGASHRPSGRRFLLLAVLACVGVLALGAGSAQAFQSFTFSFGSQGSGAGQFNNPQGVAIDQSTGDVYVVDASNFRVEKFTPDVSSQTANFDLAFGDGVNNSGSGNANICSTSCTTGTQGSSPGQFDNPVYVAVDNSGGASQGDVYVGDPGDNTVSKFDSSGNLVSSWAGTGQLSGIGTSTFQSMDGITVDSSGNLLVIDGANTVWTFSGSDGSSINNFATTRGMDPFGLDVNSAGDVFKANGDGSVEELTSTGADIGTIDEGTQTTTDLAIDRASGDLYEDLGTSIDHFQFNSSGDVVDAGGPCQVIPSGACGPTDTFGFNHLTAGTGLAYDSSENTLYVADGANDVAVFGPPEPGAPTVDSESTSSIGSTTATLNADVNPFDVQTTCTFQYISDADFVSDGSTFGAGTQTANCTPSPLTPTGFNDVAASADISGLSINTTYDFRAVATNADAPDGGVDGTTQQFTTLGAAAIDSLSASNVGAVSAELDASINPLGTDTTCVFEIVDDNDFTNNGGFSAPQTQTIACPADLGAGNTDVSTSVQVTGLTPGTLYDFEVVATNGLGSASTSDQLQTTPPLVLGTESVTHVTQNGATLSAQVNPSGSDTSVQFQFITDADFVSDGNSFGSGTQTAPSTAIDVGNGTSFVTPSVNLSGLTAGTEYHFRVTASNDVGSLQGTPESFTTLSAAPPTAGLPDNRAYELVSPAQKAGEVFSNEIIGGDQAASNGNAVGYVALSPFPNGAGPSIDDYATRGPNGWTSKPILPQQAPGTSLELPGYDIYSSDLSHVILSNGGATVNSGTDGQDDPALVPGTCTTALFPSPPQAANTPCTGEATGRPNLFLRDNSNGSFQLVDSFADAPAGQTPVGDAGAAIAGGSADLSTVVFTDPAVLVAGATVGSTNLYAWNSATAKVTLLGVGATLGGGAGRTINAVSANGSDIFVSDTSGNLDLFHPGSPTPTTIAPTQNGFSPSFMDAATDGSAVIFTDNDGAALTGSTVAGSGTNLYEASISSNGSVTISDLTGGQSTAGVDGVVGASSDGSTVYFVAEGVLASGATSGDENLYVEHGGTTKFIASLQGGGDSTDWNGSWTARVTPDGSHLAFNSSDPALAMKVDGFDNTDVNSGSPDNEVYLYDNTSGSLVCASCNATHTLPLGSSQLDPIEGGLLSGGNLYVQHNLSDDGSRLFFDSSDALSPHDVNNVEDVYEYENGSAHLISTGTSNSISLFLDASSNGNDVFFITRDQLVPQDTDGNMDVYDARVNGGFPAPSPLPPCTGDGCKPPTTAPPAAPTIGTVTFSGPGNPKPSAPKATGKKKGKKNKKKKAKIAVVSRVVVKGSQFSIKVRVAASGRLEVFGSGVGTMRKQVRGGHTYRLTLGLTATERRALENKHKGRVKIMVHLLYRPATGGSSSASVPVTVEA